MKRIYWVLVSVFLFSCGQQNVTKDILETKEVDDTPYGLAGNTYRNKNLVFKITNLPVDSWAIYADNHPLISELTLDYAKDTNTNQFVVLLLASYPKKEYKSRLDESNGILADLEIGMETQTKTDKRSAEDFSNGFMQSYPENEYYEKEGVRTKDSYSGYKFYYTHRASGIKGGIAYFIRSSRNTKRVYRLLYRAKSEEANIGREAFENMLENLEFNTL